eukprot:195762_1
MGNDVNKTIESTPKSIDAKNTNIVHNNPEAKSVSMNTAASTDISETESKPSDNDSKCDHQSVTSGSSKAIEDVQNKQRFHNLMGAYNDVNKMIESTSQTPLKQNYDLSDDLSHCIRMLNLLRPAQHQETVYRTNDTELKLYHWRNAAYFYFTWILFEKWLLELANMLHFLSSR